MAEDKNSDKNINTEETDSTPSVEKVVSEAEFESKELEQSVKAENKPQVNFNVGDKVIVNYRIKEGEKSRIQPYEGIVIGIKGGGVSKTFTVRRMAAGNIGVERIFPVFSPNIESVKVKARGKVRRAKLYYLRSRTGKSATKIKEI